MINIIKFENTHEDSELNDFDFYLILQKMINLHKPLLKKNYIV